MSSSLRFALALIALLAVLTGGAAFAINGTTRAWFERDVRARSALAVHSAQTALVREWQETPSPAIRAQLVDIARDERILSAIACGAHDALLARTDDFPAVFNCAQIAAQLPVDGAPWQTEAQLPGGRVTLTAIPVRAGGEALGFVALVHDMGFVQRREEATWTFLLLAFGILAVGALGLTLLGARLTWRGWSEELRRLLRGETGQKPEFQPLLRDVLELADRIASEKESEATEGLWSAQRLKQTLGRMLHGEKLIVVANREPYIHQRGPDGALIVQHPASGLVTALEPVMRACSGVWVAHGAGSADRETVDRHSRVRVPPGEESFQIRRVWLGKDEEQGYYYGMANEGLWPLCHVAHTQPIFRAEDWRQYQAVNLRFAEAVCEEADAPDPIVLVQDYHFALAPRLIRERLPRATILSFWHIPWPNAERLGIFPWQEEILAGLLGSSILGFHTQQHCNNFFSAVDLFLEARIDRERSAVVHRKQSTLVRPYPISIEWPSRWMAGVASVEDCRREVRAELGLAPDALLGLGVDRLDYTKGIEERLLATERMLERFPALRGRFTFVQFAAPSRTLIESYKQLDAHIVEVAARINARFGSGSYQPIVLRRSHHEPPDVFRAYRAADLCYVSSLHDGMNLVAKEFVAARDDERGVLVLSRFTGAARELTEALVVNPYDLDEASSALAAALVMSPDEQRARMQAMRAFLAEFNVHRWAGRMLIDASRLRERDRLAERLSDPPRAIEDVA